MMAAKLSRRDAGILEKIRDPESDPFIAVLLDDALPKDPHVQDQRLYERVVQQEREIVSGIQQLELEIVGLGASERKNVVEEYRTRVSALGSLILDQPSYASARNNRAQAIRRLYGDNMLVKATVEAKQELLPTADEEERMQASTTALSDLDTAIRLLSPASPFAAMSPVAARTLSMAHTQRAAIYHATAKSLNVVDSQVAIHRKEAGWKALEFEEAASRDFATGGRYGNEIAKGLAVSTNPTAKLCGQMVQEMMKNEYGPSLA